MTVSSPNIHRQIEALRPDLLRFARLQLRNDAWAEDAVQETLIAVLQRPDAFAGQSALKTFVIGILKHKIIDQLRVVKREVHIEVEEGDSESDAFDSLFLADGHFREPQKNWGNPDADLERREFFEILQVCVDKLPKNIGRIFMMREWLELETEEICKELGISTSNCWVMLYRARMRLKECLELNWFNEKGTQKFA
jgi:RNA polymerase sigma-70 factor (ECF subfamily)